MQSDSEDDWDEDWDDDSDTSFFSDISVASRMKLAGGAAFVILLLLCSMIFTNFGFYYGAGHKEQISDIFGNIS